MMLINTFISAKAQQEGLYRLTFYTANETTRK